MTDKGFDLLLAIGDIDEQLLNSPPVSKPKIFTVRRIALAASFILVIGIILVFAVNIMLGGAKAPDSDYDDVGDNYENLNDSNTSTDGTDVSGTADACLYAVLYTDAAEDSAQDEKYNDGATVHLLQEAKKVRLKLNDGKLKIVLKCDTYPTVNASATVIDFSDGYAEIAFEAREGSYLINNVTIEINATSQAEIYELSVSLS